MERKHYDLQPFREAQQRDFSQALAEIRAGQKRSHWIWYIFPQLRGLGYSDYAVYYGLEDLEEARLFLQDPMLGANLREITQALLELPQRDPHQVMGSPDHLKLRSCMTLFAQAAGEGSLFQQVLEKYYNGKPDAKTLSLLA